MHARVLAAATMARLAAGLALSLAAPAYAQQPAAQQPTAQQPPAQQNAQEPDKPITIEEQVVVSASRTEQKLVNAPAAVSVITTQTIENSPATNPGDLMRTVPGVNVTQVSARDVNITTRGATSTLATSQLALVDGRSIYLDFFGMVMWDLVPTSPHEIKQIEVVRGPAALLPKPLQAALLIPRNRESLSRLADLAAAGVGSRQP